MRNNGFVFVSVEGHYASVRNSFDHGSTREVISWVTSIDDAEVFPHEDIARRKFKELEKAQSLRAVETRVVQFHAWVKPELIPVASLQPLEPQFHRTAWLDTDCDRRVIIDGTMVYFADTDVLPVKVKHSQVEFQHGHDAWMSKYKKKDSK